MFDRVVFRLFLLRIHEASSRFNISLFVWFYKRVLLANNPCLLPHFDAHALRVQAVGAIDPCNP